MAKKPKNYVPQQRQRSKDTLASAPVRDEVATHEQDATLEQTLDKLATAFEVESVARGEQSTNFLGSLTASLVGSNNLLSSIGLTEFDESVVSEDSLRAYLPELVVSARNAALQLAEEGYDRIHSHEIIPRKDFGPLFAKLLMKQLSYMGIKSEDLNDIDFNQFTNLDNLDLDAMLEIDGLEFTAYGRLVRVYGLSKGMSRKMKESGSLGLELYDEFRDTALKSLEREMEQNPSTVRRETTKQLQYLFSDEVSRLLDYFGYADDAQSDAPATPEMSFPTQELDFTVLPTGVGLEEIVSGIIDRLNERDKAHVDLNRVAVLNTIREFVGKDRCYFAHGKKSGRQMLDQESDTLIDEDYVVLVIQNLNDNGTTQSEHALAISPIAQKHAAYLTRDDVSAGNWREILSLPKQDARYFGARDLRFTGSTGRTPYAMMEEKIKALLECHSDDFHEKLRMRADGSYRLENTKREVGKSALTFNIAI